MIIKAVRVAAHSARRVCAHVFRGAENECVAVVIGTEADVMDYARDAKLQDATFAFRHWIIAPSTDTSRQQAIQLVGMLAVEFHFDPDQCVLVEHEKPRAIESAFNRHWHLCVREIDPTSGRSLSSSYDHPRHEFISRVAEWTFGHPFTSGAHDRAVLARLRREARIDVAAAFSSALTPNAERPREAFSHGAHQMAKQRGRDLPQDRLFVKHAWANTTTRADFEAALAGRGIGLTPGDKADRWMLAFEGDKLAELGRFAKLQRSEINKRMEGEHEHKRSRAGADNCSVDYVPIGSDRRTPEPPRQRRHIPDNAPSARGPGLSDESHRSSVASRERDGEDTREFGGSPYPAARARNREGDRVRDQGKVASAADLPATAETFLKLTIRAKNLARPFPERAELHLAQVERDARSTVAKAKRETLVSREYVDNSIAAEQQAREVMDKLGAEIRELTAQILEIRNSRERRPWPFGRNTRDNESRIEELTEKREQLNARLRISREVVVTAIGSVERAKKKLQGETIVQNKKLNDVMSEYKLILNDVNQARRLMQVWPPIAFCGANFTFRAGKRVESARRQILRNPFATDIWGLPLAGPD